MLYKIDSVVERITDYISWFARPKYTKESLLMFIYVIWYDHMRITQSSNMYFSMIIETFFEIYAECFLQS